MSNRGFFSKHRISIISLITSLVFFISAFAILLIEIPENNPVTDAILGVNNTEFVRNMVFMFLFGMGIVTGLFVLLIDKVAVKSDQQDFLY